MQDDDDADASDSHPASLIPMEPNGQQLRERHARRMAGYESAKQTWALIQASLANYARKLR